MEAHDFNSLLKNVADEVQQPVKKNLFENKEPDLWGSHIESRWYLKDTADNVDKAEQAKFSFRRFGGRSRAARRVKFPPANRS